MRRNQCGHFHLRRLGDNDVSVGRIRSRNTSDGDGETGSRRVLDLDCLGDVKSRLSSLLDSGRLVITSAIEISMCCP